MTLDFSPGSNLPFKLPDLTTRLFPLKLGKAVEPRLQVTRFAVPKTKQAETLK